MAQGNTQGKLEQSPAYIGGILFLIGLAMTVFDIFPIVGKTILSFGVCIVFSVLGSKADVNLKNPLFVFCLVVALASFAAFLIFLSAAAVPQPAK